MRSALKQLLFGIQELAGINAWSRRRRRHDLVVLNYHGVIEEDRSQDDRNLYGNTVSVAEFSQHLEYITRYLHPVRASDVERWAHGGSQLPSHAVLLTFDDGYRNNLQYAAPLLKRYKVPAIVFVSTGYLGARRILWPEEIYQLALHWPRGDIPSLEGSGVFALDPNRRARARELQGRAKELSMRQVEEWLAERRREAPVPSDLADTDLYAFLTWEETRQLTGFGFEIGSHTVNHCILTRCGPEELRSELWASKREIEQRLGLPCNSFCYPNGHVADWSDETAFAVREAGYQAAYILPDKFQPGGQVNAYAINRVMVPGHVSQDAFRARVSGTVEALRGAFSRHG